MRIHTSAGFSLISEAARFAQVDLVKFTRHGSRTHMRAFDIGLEGASRRRPNGGTSGAGSGYAATWDQWGVFLGHIFRIDPSAKCWAYTDAEDFHTKTGNRFNLHDNLTGDDAKTVTYSSGQSLTYWPYDAHGDHTFRTEYTSHSGEWGHVQTVTQRCVKLVNNEQCTAKRRW